MIGKIECWFSGAKSSRWRSTASLKLYLGYCHLVSSSIYFLFFRYRLSSNEVFYQNSSSSIWTQHLSRGPLEYPVPSLIPCIECVRKIRGKPPYLYLSRWCVGYHGT